MTIVLAVAAGYDSKVSLRHRNLVPVAPNLLPNRHIAIPASIAIDLDAQANPKTVIIGFAELWVGSPVEPIHVELGHTWDISASTNCASIDIIRSKVGDKFTFGTIASLYEAAHVDVESVGNDRGGHCQRN